MKKTIYEPGEDSYLLQKYVKRFASGKVLDMGGGSGILGATALERKSVDSVTFADINIDAISELKQRIENDKAIFIHTDLFSAIKDKDFDTIIFNPPYLPEDEFDDEKAITTGGVHGYELIIEFLKQSKSYLAPQGIILLLFSSLSDKKVIDDAIKSLGFEKQLLSRQNLFMERLYVYLLRNKKGSNMIKGHRGVVEIKDIGKNRVAVKKAINRHYDAVGEAKFLKLLNKQGIGPELLKSDNQSITMKYVEGERILEYFQNATQKNIKTVIKKILVQLYIMDELKINKNEMTNPYKHIIIQNENPIMIDFERCQYTHKPKNITQFIQFLSSSKVRILLEKKGFHIDEQKLRNIANAYKKKIDEKIIEKIICSIE